MLVQRAKDFLQSLKTRGLTETLSLLYSTFEDGLSTKPFAKETAEGLDTKIEGAQLYIPTKFKPFEELLSKLSFKPEDIFVDMGAGKGRAMIIAAKAGFKKVKGIELSKELFNEGQEILKSAQGDFELIHSNVLDYDIKDEDNIFYFYDPFSNETLEKCLTKISNCGHPFTIIYHNNIDDKKEVFSKFKNLSLEATEVLSGNRFLIYKAA